MLILLRESDPSGQPLVGSGLLIPGETALEIVRKMQAASPFRGDSLVLYMRRVLSGVGDGKASPGGPPEQAAREFLERLARRGFVEFMKEPTNEGTCPAQFKQALFAIRDSGLANMFDHPLVACLAREFDYPEVAEWIEQNPCEYTEFLLNGGIRALRNDLAEEEDTSCADKQG